MGAKSFWLPPGWGVNLLATGAATLGMTLDTFNKARSLGLVSRSDDGAGGTEFTLTEAAEGLTDEEVQRSAQVYDALRKHR